MSFSGNGGSALSRRDLFRLAGGAAGAAGLFAAARFVPPIVGGDERHLTALPSLEHAPTLESKVNISISTTPAGQVLAFRSRPDLQLALPQLSTDLPGQDPGFVLTDTHAGPGGQGPLILDSSGRQPVWFNQISLDADPSKRAFNLRLGRYKGQPVLTWFEGAVVNEHGEGHYVITDSSYSTVKTVQAGNGYVGDLHEFFLTPQGTAYFTCFGLGHADLRPYGGSANGAFYYGVAQEVDVDTGKVLFQWRSDQHVSFDDSYCTPKQYGTEPWDYFHINAISLDGNGDLLICSRNTSTIYKVSRSTGEIIYRIGGKQSDFSFAPGAQFAWQHDATAQPDGTITVFDNGAGVEVTQPESRALVLGLNMSSKTVELYHQYPHPDGAILANALGSVQLLESGHTFIGWGNRGWFTELGPTGQTLLNGRLAGNTTLSYRAFRSPWTATPPGPPDIAVEAAGQTTMVYASWNGATEVDRWAVLGGPSKNNLSVVGVAPKAGFEMEITVPGRPAHLAIAALDTANNELGRSGTLKS